VLEDVLDDADLLRATRGAAREDERDAIGSERARHFVDPSKTAAEREVDGAP
jgi:hypothetical protein